MCVTCLCRFTSDCSHSVVVHFGGVWQSWFHLGLNGSSVPVCVCVSVLKVHSSRWMWYDSLTAHFLSERAGQVPVSLSRHDLKSLTITHHTWIKFFLNYNHLVVLFFSPVWGAEMAVSSFNRRQWASQSLRVTAKELSIVGPQGKNSAIAERFSKYVLDCVSDPVCWRLHLFMLSLCSEQTCFIFLFHFHHCSLYISSPCPHPVTLTSGSSQFRSQVQD